jgi:hypothetical protein
MNNNNWDYITLNSKLKAKEAKVNTTMYPYDNQINKNIKKFTIKKRHFLLLKFLNYMKVGTCVEGY